MKQDDGKIGEVEPRRVKQSTPIMHETIHSCAAVELCAHCLKDEARVHGKGRESALGDLEGMSTLEYWHARFHLGVHGRRQAPNLNCYTVLWDK